MVRVVEFCFEENLTGWGADFEEDFYVALGDELDPGFGVVLGEMEGADYVLGS